MDVRLKSQYQLRQVSPEPSNGIAEEIEQEQQIVEEQLRIEENRRNGASIRWIQLRKLGSVLYPTSSPSGRPTTFVCGSKFLAIGTFSADVLLFDYDQTLVAQLNLHARLNGEMLGPVTSLAFSADESHILAGYGLGSVCLFDLEAPPSVRPKLMTYVPSVDLSEQSSNTAKFQQHESHIRGKPVIACGFVSEHRKTFVSIDASGVVILHKHHRVLLEYKTRSRRILGSFDRPTPLLSASIYGNVVALLTTDLLEVVMIDNDGLSTAFTEVVSIPRSKDTDEKSPVTGITNFYRGSGIGGSGGSGDGGINLVYSWGKQLKLLNLDLTQPVGQMASVVSGFTHEMDIEQLDWINPDMVIVVSGQSRLDLVKLSDALIVDTDKSVPSQKLVKLAVCANSLFALGKYEFSIGRIANWADRLLAFVNNGEPSAAIRLAMHFYDSDGDMSIFGLPRNSAARKLAIRQAIPDLILTAVSFSAQYDHESLKTLLPEAVRAATHTKLNILEQILEIVENEQWSRNLYMRTLMSLIRDRKLKSLPAHVFRELVITDSDPQLFYNLDLSSLDLDLAFKLCAKYPEKLTEAKIYLENMAFGDFVTPLYDNDHVFGYMALVLTSRIYPTSEDMDETRAERAKSSIYGALFLDDNNHTLLQKLLDLDTVAFYTALNEAFEDPWLNESNEISRQAIVNTLLNISSGNGSGTNQNTNQNTNNAELCIFIARNYPKYRQYLVLPGDILHNVVLQLCDHQTLDPEEAQLALLSLLSVYKPWDLENFTEIMISARYMLVLHQIYRKQGKLLKLVELKLKFRDLKDFWPILSTCMVNNRGPTVLFIVQHLEELVEVDAQMLSKLVVSYGIDEATSYSVITQFSEEEHQYHQRSYLNALFSEIQKQGGRLPSMDIRVLYITILASNPDPDDQLMQVIDNVFTSPEDIELPSVVDCLIANDRIDALTVLLCRLDRGPEAMIYLLNFIPDLAQQQQQQQQQSDSGDASSGAVGGGENASTALAKHVRLACDISIGVSKTDIDEGNRLCQRLIETLIECGATDELNYVASTMIESSVLKASQIAKYLLDESSNSDESTRKAYNKELPVLVANIYRELVRKERGLQSFLEIVMKDGYKELLEVLAGRARGWIVPITSECELCGSKLVGLGIEADKLYDDWWDRLMDPESEGHEDQAIITFACGHSYRARCLRRVTDKRECVICNPR